MKSWMVIGLSMLGGAVVSVTVSRALVREAHGAPRSGAEPTLTVPRASAGSEDDLQRWQLERQRASMRAALGPGAADEAAGDEEGDEEPRARPEPQQADYPTAEQAMARNRQLHRDLVAAVRAQPADPTWSPAAQSKFTEDLEALGASVDDIECRAHGCVATLQWPDRAAAQQGYGELVHAEYQLPCDRRIFLDEAAGDGAYRAELLLDCEHVRARGRATEN